MALDPQARQVLDMVQKSGAPEMWQLTPDEARAEYVKRTQKAKPEIDIYQSRDEKIPGSDGPISIRIYTPRPAKENELFSVLVWFHGGGFVIGDLDTHDSACRALANEADMVVVSVDYRLAPEHKFPAAVEDCWTATKWVANNANSIGCDVTRIAVGGDSAGGNLAAVVALLARNEGYPKLGFQLLVYPCVAPEPETRSHHEFSEGYLLTRRTITWFFKQYLRTQKDTKDIRYAPLVESDLSNLPPALVIIAGFDPLRDEGVSYAQALIEGGNRVKLSNYEGMIHGFYLMGKVLDAANDAISESAREMKKYL